MGKTIIQPIGPLYGEPVNGTVYGRPNGSVYVPITNTISLLKYTAYITNVSSGGNKRVRFSDDQGVTTNYGFVAASQDIASNVKIVIAADSDLTTILANQPFSAGVFNRDSVPNIVGNYELTEGTTYYIAALLVNNDTVVATSNIQEVTAV